MIIILIKMTNICYDKNHDPDNDDDDDDNFEDDDDDDDDDLKLLRSTMVADLLT